MLKLLFLYFLIEEKEFYKILYKKVKKKKKKKKCIKGRDLFGFPAHQPEGYLMQNSIIILSLSVHVKAIRDLIQIAVQYSSFVQIF